MPSWVAPVFILAMKAGRLPASQRARVKAMLLADRTSSPSSNCRSVSTSPTCTGTVDWSVLTSALSSATSCAVMVTEGPSAPAAKGWSCRMTTATIILVRLATGTGTSGPDCAA